MDFLPRKLQYFLILIPIILFLWLGGAFTLLVWKGDTIYLPQNSKNLTYKVPVDTSLVRNKFGENIEILTTSSNKSNQAIFLYLHGNVGRIPRIIEGLSEFGMVISPAYPGFSGSEGKPSTERLYDTVDTTFQWLISFGITPNQVTVIGHSMGGAVAVYAASEYPEISK
jgi:pimeloyl-ACP methyl ester carboxylesterase